MKADLLIRFLNNLLLWLLLVLWTMPVRPVTRDMHVAHGGFNSGWQWIETP